jgi:lysophospholipase L1-like esterase
MKPTVRLHHAFLCSLSLVFLPGPRACLSAPPAMPESIEALSAAPSSSSMPARGRNPAVIEGLEILPAGCMKVRLTAGKVRVMDKEVTVPETILDLAPPVQVEITDEATTLTDQKPEGFARGTALKHCLGFGIATFPCLEPGSIVVKDQPGEDGLIYEKDRDWRADETWGRVGRLPEGRIKAGQKVNIDYRIQLSRVDTIAIDHLGRVGINRGDSQKLCPRIPAADYGSLALGRIFLDHATKEITEREIYPIGAAYEPDPAAIETYRDRVAATRAKLEQGEDVTIVAWGDSVTAGGDASRPELRFGEAFVQALRFKYPAARINFINAGRGGWFSTKSLPLFEDDVLKHKPDLVTMEFVNDMRLPEPVLRQNWFEAIDRVRAVGGEPVIVTPHFVLPLNMNFPGLGTPETRANVEGLRQIATEKEVALADASKRWEHLALEGIPYPIHLGNGINHPDDFGHALFVEELMRLF